MFWSMKPLLLNQAVSIRRRLKLFDTTVGSAVTWCCESWTPRKDELRRLETARRSMLRKIVGCGRKPEEDWVDWIQRTTRKALQWASRAGIHSWTDRHFKRKWAWAGHVARASSMRWLHRVSMWRDSEWQTSADGLGLFRDLRPTTRRRMKWEDTIRRFCSHRGLQPWTEVAQHREWWRGLLDEFSEWAA